MFVVDSSQHDLKQINSWLFGDFESDSSEFQCWINYDKFTSECVLF